MEVILKMAITKYESAMDPNLTSYGHSRSDPGVMSLSQASVHLREYQTRVEEANSRERKSKRSNLSAAVSAFEISTFLAQHNRDLCRELSLSIEGPNMPIFAKDSSNPTFEARLQAAISENFSASFVLHHRLLSYYLYSGRFADIITHIDAYNRVECGLTTNIEWTRWCERFCSELLERHFECRFGSSNALDDEMASKYLKLEDVNLFELIVLRLRLIGQRNSLETEFSTISEYSELCEAYARAIEASDRYMVEVLKDSLYAKREEEWTSWKAEMQHTNFSQKWRSFLRLSAVAAEPSPLVQQAWDWLVQSFDNEDFMHLERWSLDSNYDGAPYFLDFSSPIQSARLTRYSEDCKFAHLLLSNTTASGKNKESSKKYSKFVLAVPPPSNLSANFFLSMAIKCDMILLAHARETREWTWTQNKLFFYFEFSRFHALPMILDFLIHLRAPEGHKNTILPDLLSFIALQKTDDKRIAQPWSSPLLPWVELIKQPFFDVTSLTDSSDQKIWASLLDAITSGNDVTLSVDLETSMDGSSSLTGNGLLSTPARKPRASLLTPSRTGTPGGVRSFLTPQRPRVGFSQPSTPAAVDNKSSKITLDLLKSTLPIDRNSFFVKQIKRSESKILGSLASHDPNTISDITNTTNTLLSLLEWSASRYAVAKKSTLKIAPSTIASHVVAALNVDAFFIAICLPSAHHDEQSALESAAIFILDSLLRLPLVGQLPISAYESLLKHTSTMQENVNAAILSAELWELIATREGEASTAHKRLLSSLERAETLFESGRSDSSRVIFADFETRLAHLKSSVPSVLATPGSSKTSSNISSFQTPGKVPTRSLFENQPSTDSDIVRSQSTEEQLQQAFASRLRRGLAKITTMQQSPIQIDYCDMEYLRPFSSSTSVGASTLPSIVPANISIPSTPADAKKKPDITASSISTPGTTPAPMPSSAAEKPPVTPITSGFTGFGTVEPSTPKNSFTPFKPFTAQPAPVASTTSTPISDVSSTLDKEALRAQLRAEMEAEIAKEKAALLAQREELERERKLFHLSKESAKKEEEKKRMEYQRIVQEHQMKIAAEAEELERRALGTTDEESSDSDSDSSTSSSDSPEAARNTSLKASGPIPHQTRSASLSFTSNRMSLDAGSSQGHFNDGAPKRTSPRAHPLVPKLFSTAPTAGKPSFTFGTTKTSPTGSAQTSPTTPTSANSNSVSVIGTAPTTNRSSDASPSSVGTPDSTSTPNSNNTKGWAPLPKNAFSFGAKSSATTQAPAFLGSRPHSASAPPPPSKDESKQDPKKSEGQPTPTETMPSTGESSVKPATPTLATPSAFGTSGFSKPSFGFGQPGAFGAKTGFGFGAKPTVTPPVATTSAPSTSTASSAAPITPVSASVAPNVTPSATESKNIEKENTETGPSAEKPAASAPAVHHGFKAPSGSIPTNPNIAANAVMSSGSAFASAKPTGSSSLAFKPFTPSSSTTTKGTSVSDPKKPDSMSDAERAEVRPKPINSATSAFMSGAAEPSTPVASNNAVDPQKPVGMSDAEWAEVRPKPVNSATSAFMSGTTKPSTPVASSNAEDPKKPAGMSDAEWAEVRPKPINSATSAFMSGPSSKPASSSVVTSDSSTDSSASKPSESTTFKPFTPASSAKPTSTFGSFGASTSTPPAFKPFTPLKANEASVPAPTSSNLDPQKPVGMSDAEWAEVRPKPVNSATSAFMSGTKPSTPVAPNNAGDPQKPAGMSDAEWAEVRPKPINSATSAFMSGSSSSKPSVLKTSESIAPTFKPFTPAATSKPPTTFGSPSTTSSAAPTFKPFTPSAATPASDPKKPDSMSDAEWAEVRPKPINSATSAFMSGAAEPSTPVASNNAVDPQKPVGMSDAEWAEVRPKPVNSATSAFMSGTTKPSTPVASSNAEDPKKPAGMSDAEWAEVRPKPINSATSAFMSGPSSKPASSSVVTSDSSTSKSTLFPAVPKFGSKFGADASTLSTTATSADSVPTIEGNIDKEGEKDEQLKEEAEKKEEVSKPSYGFSSAAQQSKTQFSFSTAGSQGKSTFTWNSPAPKAPTSIPDAAAIATPPKFGEPASKLATAPQFATDAPKSTFGFGSSGFSFGAKSPSKDESGSADKSSSATPSALSNVPKAAFPASFGSGFGGNKTSAFGFKAPSATQESKKSEDASKKIEKVEEEGSHVEEAAKKSESETKAVADSTSTANPQDKKIVWREASLDDDDESWANDDVDDGDDDEEPKEITAKSTVAPPTNNLSKLLAAANLDDDDLLTDDEDVERSMDESIDDGMKTETSSKPAASNALVALAAAGGLGDDDDDDDWAKDMDDDDDEGGDHNEAKGNRAALPTKAPSANLPAALASAGAFGDDDEDWDVTSDPGSDKDEESTPAPSTDTSAALTSALDSAGDFGDDDDF